MRATECAYCGRHPRDGTARSAVAPPCEAPAAMAALAAAAAARAPGSRGARPRRDASAGELRAGVARRRGAAVASASEAEAAAACGGGDTAEELALWLHRDGAEGAAGEAQRVAMSECAPATGARGLVTTVAARSGDVLLRVPLAMCLTDLQPCDSCPDGAPWSVRVAARLLEERAKGDASAYAPFIASLPWGRVTTPLQMGWDDTQAIQWAHVRQELYELDWLVNHWYEEYRQRNDAAEDGKATPATPVPAPLGDFEAALTLVHSRTFLACVEEGGSNASPWFARVLVPLGDMINHDGVAHNTAWTYEDDGLAGKAMVFRATRDLLAGEEILADYGHQCIDDLFTYYGFVPRGAPADAAPLFGAPIEALEWWLFARGQEENEAALERANALLAWMEGGGHDAAADVARSGQDTAAGGGKDATKGLRVHIGGSVDQQLLEAFVALELACDAGPGEAASEAEVSKALLGEAHAMVKRRCRELLQAAPSSLREDLAALGEGPQGVNSACAFADEAELPVEAGATKLPQEAREALSAAEESVARLNAAKKIVLCEVLANAEIAL